jgi:hypothetical protein
MVNEKFPIVHVKCRKGGDPATAGQECPCMQAYNMSSQGSSIVHLKCIRCGHVWAIPVGGQLSFPPGV